MSNGKGCRGMAGCCSGSVRCRHGSSRNCAMEDTPMPASEGQHPVLPNPAVAKMPVGEEPGLHHCMVLFKDVQKFAVRSDVVKLLSAYL